MTGVTAQATGQEEIMFFFSDNSFAAHLLEVIFHSYLPSIHIFTKRERKAEKEGKQLIVLTVSYSHNTKALCKNMAASLRIGLCLSERRIKSKKQEKDHKKEMMMRLRLVF